MTQLTINISFAVEKIALQTGGLLTILCVYTIMYNHCYVLFVRERE